MHLQLTLARLLKLNLTGWQFQVMRLNRIINLTAEISFWTSRQVCQSLLSNFQNIDTILYNEDYCWSSSIHIVNFGTSHVVRSTFEVSKTKCSVSTSENFIVSFCRACNMIVWSSFLRTVLKFFDVILPFIWASIIQKEWYSVLQRVMPVSISYLKWARTSYLQLYFEE